MAEPGDVQLREAFARFRAAPGAMPRTRLNARLNAASDR